MTEKEVRLVSESRRMQDEDEQKLPASSRRTSMSLFAGKTITPFIPTPAVVLEKSLEKTTTICEQERALLANDQQKNRKGRLAQSERTFSSPRLTTALLFFSLLLLPAAGDAILSNSREMHARRCSPISIPMCQKLGYNQTYFPNRFGHETQEEAGMEAHQFWPLVNVNCYSHLRFFLCAMYAPICQENYDKHVPPCREVCQAAKNGCVQLMQKYGFAWPETLNCNQLPRQSDMQNTGNICAAPPNTPDLHIDTPPSETELDQPTNRNSFADHEETPFTTKVDLSSNVCECRCSRPFYLLSDASMKKVAVGNVTHCAYPCYSPFLRNDNDQQNFLTTWIGIWAVACFCLSLFTVLTFVIEVDRFQYPERPIFVLAFCQMMVSCGYILRLGYGHDMVACEQVRIRNQTDGSPLCIAVFVLVYFFGMAAAVWWVVLALTWLLAAGFKWSSEAIASYAPWFHVFAWAMPALQTFIVLMFNFVDGDPMSGMCYVGNTNLLALRTLVLGPLVAYLTLGAFFLVAGFMNLWRIRAVVKKQQGSGKTGKLTQLMSKIGVFSVLYTIPAMAVIGAYFYESHYRPLWEAANNCPCAPQVHPGDAFYLLSLIKYASTLIVGVTSGVWICSRKTLSSWRRVFCALLHCRVPEPSPSHLYQPADLIYIKSHTDVSSSQVYGSTVRHHGGYGAMLPEKV